MNRPRPFGLVGAFTRLRAQAPAPALWFGLGALVPLYLGAAAMLVGPFDLAINAYLHLVHYAALLLAFNGALHWGLAIAAAMHGRACGWRPYVWGAAAVVLAWLALGMASPYLRLGTLLIGYSALFSADLAAVADGLAPDWYKSLRKLLTVAALVAVGGALLAVVKVTAGSS